MKIRSVVGAAMTCGVFLYASSASAHHSFAAEWDSKNCREFTGTPKPIRTHGSCVKHMQVRAKGSTEPDALRLRVEV